MLEQHNEVDAQESEQRLEFEDFFTYFVNEQQSQSYDINDAEERIHALAKGRTDLAARPFANAIYWAGFQILGW